MIATLTQSLVGEQHCVARPNGIERTIDDHFTCPTLVGVGIGNHEEFLVV